MEFRPGTFSDMSGTPLGLRLWAYLNRPDSIVRMETACYLDRPAAEALVLGLLAEFGDEVRLDRIKQLIGVMIRQIMEDRGYRIDRQNVRVPPSRKDLFTSATRYTKAA